MRLYVSVSVYDVSIYRHRDIERHRDIAMHLTNTDTQTQRHTRPTTRAYAGMGRLQACGLGLLVEGWRFKVRGLGFRARAPSCELTGARSRGGAGVVVGPGGGVGPGVGPPPLPLALSLAPSLPQAQFLPLSPPVHQAPPLSLAPPQPPTTLFQ